MVANKQNNLLLVNTGRAGLPELLGRDRASELLQNVPQLARRVGSLVLVSADDDFDLCHLLDVAWGNDAVIGLISTQSKEELLLCKITRFRSVV